MTKIKYGCGDSTMATCVTSEVVPNSQSSILENQCNSQEDVNEDVYGQLENIQTNSDLTELIEQCLDYVLVGGKLFVKNALLKQGEEICALKAEIETLKNRQLCDIPIGECLEDFSCLIAPCDGTILTLKDWMIAVQTKICTP